MNKIVRHYLEKQGQAGRGALAGAALGGLTGAGLSLSEGDSISSSLSRGILGAAMGAGAGGLAGKLRAPLAERVSRSRTDKLLRRKPSKLDKALLHGATGLGATGAVVGGIHTMENPYQAPRTNKLRQKIESLLGYAGIE